MLSDSRPVTPGIHTFNWAADSF